MGMKINTPLEFPGTPDEKRVNWATHDFGGEARCLDCDCRPWGIVSTWPCGAVIPRVTVTV